MLGYIELPPGFDPQPHIERAFAENGVIDSFDSTPSRSMLRLDPLFSSRADVQARNTHASTQPSF
jgi:hypothetical protein